MGRDSKRKVKRTEGTKDEKTQNRGKIVIVSVNNENVVSKVRHIDDCFNSISGERK